MLRTADTINITRTNLQYIILFIIQSISLGGMVLLMPLSTILQLHRSGQFYWWRKLEYLEKNTDLTQFTDQGIH